MATTSISDTILCASEIPALPPLFDEPRWYVAYTSAHHEKRVAEQLALRAFEHFLPLYSLVRRWKDRRVTLQLPLFPGYVFVRLALRRRLQVLQIPGVARFVQFHGLPAAMPEEEIAALQKGLASGVPATPHPYIAAGRRVRIKGGPLAGLEGVVRRTRGGMRVVLSLELIQRSVAVDIDALDLEPLHASGTAYAPTASPATKLGDR